MTERRRALNVKNVIVHRELVATNKERLSIEDLRNFYNLFEEGGEMDIKFRDNGLKDEKGKFIHGVQGKVELEKVMQGVLLVTFRYQVVGG